MKQTTEKLRSLHIQMVAMIEHLRDEIHKYDTGEPANAIYDARATIAEAAGYLWNILLRLEKLEKGVDSSG